MLRGNTYNTEYNDKTMCRVFLYTAAGILIILGILMPIMNTSDKTDTKTRDQTNTHATFAFIAAAFFIIGGCVIPNSKRSSKSKELLNKRKRKCQNYKKFKEKENDLLNKHECKNQGGHAISDLERGPAASKCRAKS